MTKYEIGSLSSKLAGIYAWFQSLTLFGIFSASYLNAQGGPLAISLILPGILFALVGAALFIGSARVSRLLLPSPDNEAVASIDVTASDAQIVAFSVVGLALFLFGLPQASHYLTGVLLSSPFYPEGTPVKVRLLQELPGIVSVVVRLILGFALFVRPQPVAAWWTRKQQPASTLND